MLKNSFIKALIIICLAGLPVFSQIEHALDYSVGLNFGLTKTIEMDAQSVGAGKHLGVDFYYKFFPYMAAGGEFKYTHIERITIKSHAPRISLGMAQIKPGVRFKTRDNHRNVYGFIDVTPGFTLDMTPEDPKDSGVEYKSYWGPMITTSIGTVMGTGMLKFSLDNLLLDGEMITWFSLSLGLGI